MLRRTVPLRSAAVADAVQAWLPPLLDRQGIVTAETRQYGAHSVVGLREGSPHDTVPVRCMVATQGIARGQRVCTVPASLVLDGQTADRLLYDVVRAAHQESASRQLLRHYDDFTDQLRRLPRASPRILASQDALLMTAALYVCHSHRYVGLTPQSRMLAWIRTMPSRVPPFGVLLRKDLDGKNCHTPLQRQLRLGSRTTPLLPHTDTREASTELMVAAVEEKGLSEGLRSPRTEVALTQAILTDFYEGRHTALTERQFEAAAAHTQRHGSSAAVKRLAELEAELRTAVLAPLLEALCPGFGAASASAGEYDSAFAEELEAMRWAHFTVRSRALNRQWRRGPARIAVIPFLDCLNHAHTGANVVYSCGASTPDDSGGEVRVTASRAIRPGEELVLHYGNVGQRGCLFGDELTRPNDQHGAAVTLDDSRRLRAEAVTREVRAIEEKQRREMTVDEDAPAASEDNPVFALPRSDSSSSSGLSARGHESQQSAAETDATKEATWLWRYGFLRSADERAYEASHLWSRGLRNRLAHLTDVRRKGQPGAFVVGVPEGLEHLRSQREALERERYGNTHVFPPQRS